MGCWAVGSVVFVESVVFVGSFLLPLGCWVVGLLGCWAVWSVVFVESVVFVGSFLLPFGC